MNYKSGFALFFLGTCLMPVWGRDATDWKTGDGGATTLDSSDRIQTNLSQLYHSLAEIPTPINKGLVEFLKVFESIILNMDSESSTNIHGEHQEDCFSAIHLVIADARESKLYAVQMFDSWGTPELGFLEANWRWPGHYYECWSSEGDVVSGMWCEAYLGKRYEPYVAGYPMQIDLGSCFPRICSEISVKTILQELYDSLPIQKVTCPLPPNKLTVGDIIGIVISSILFALVSLATVIDIYERMRLEVDEIQERNRSRSNGGKVLRCFSLVTNSEKILDMRKRPGTIPVLDGIRFFSTTWIVIFHVYINMPFLLDNTAQAERRVRDNASIMVLANGYYAVDSFFFIGGLLVTYLGIHQLTKNSGHINVPLMYIQRYMRITPAYAYLILFSVGLYKYVGSGPYWKTNADAFNDMCKDQWYTNLLYINVLFPANETCLPWGWYLALDMQFYILSPIFFIVLYKKGKFGIVLISMVCVASMLTTGLLTYFSNLQPFVYSGSVAFAPWYHEIYNSSRQVTYSEKFSTNTYRTPWCRISVYMIGMLTGYVLHETKMKIKMRKAVAWIGWILAIGVACAVVYGPFVVVEETTTFSRGLATFYEIFARPLWAICLAWLVIACVSGYGGPIKTFLDWSVFAPLGRLTYSSYLVHYLVIFWYIESQETPLHFLTINMVYVYLGTLTITFGCGFVVAVFIEWPMVGLGKLAFQPRDCQQKTLLPTSNDNNGPFEQYVPYYVNHGKELDEGSSNVKQETTVF